MPREPQSYGSNEEWVTGKTAGQVNDQKSTPPPEHREFYDDRRDSEISAPDQGGKTSDVQLAENDEPVGQSNVASEPSTKVNSHEGGAKRDSFFKQRDYE
ncbi:MAG TPA: hypothetical protein VF787_26125 [Thermoanaerobaculia bacterium]